jgi:hypothetical protein
MKIADSKNECRLLALLTDIGPGRKKLREKIGHYSSIINHFHSIGAKFTTLHFLHNLCMGVIN